MGIFWGYFGDIFGIFWEYFGNILDIASRKYYQTIDVNHTEISTSCFPIISLHHSPRQHLSRDSGG